MKRTHETYAGIPRKYLAPPERSILDTGPSWMTSAATTTSSTLIGKVALMLLIIKFLAKSTKFSKQTSSDVDQFFAGLLLLEPIGVNQIIALHRLVSYVQ